MMDKDHPHHQPQPQQPQQQFTRPEGVPPAGYFWHTECAHDTCKQPRPQPECPPKTICQRCGIFEHNKPFCPKVSPVVGIDLGLWCRIVLKKVKGSV